MHTLGLCAQKGNGASPYILVAHPELERHLAALLDRLVD
jgi:hypothetical protein